MREKEKWITGLTQDTQEKILLAHILDQFRICEEQCYATHTRFLDLRQRTLADALLKKAGASRFVFFGGYDQAERCVLLFYPDYWTAADAVAEENNPVCLLRAEKSPADDLSHRDYLGSLMGLGIERDCVGDILVHGQGAELLVMRDMADYILNHYEKAGRKRLRLQRQPLCELRQGEQDCKILRESVASLRLDGVLAAAFGMSRSEAAEQLRRGLVYRNFLQCTKGEKEVAQGDVLNIRGKGKAEIAAIGGQSRKGRIFVEIRRFS